MKHIFLFAPALLASTLIAGCTQAAPAADTNADAKADTAVKPAPLALTTGKSAGITLTVSPDNAQEITQWGFATQNRPDWGTPWTIYKHPKSLDALYRESGATLLRVGIPWETYTSEKHRAALKETILAATSRGLSWYGVPWSPPVSFKTIEKPNGKYGQELNRLKPGFEDEVAAWLTGLVIELKNEGVPLPVGIGVQNEPDFGPPGYPGCVYTAQQMQTAVIELRQKLDAAGLQAVKVVGDEGAKPVDDFYPQPDPDSGTLSMLGLQTDGAINNNAAYKDALGIVATHTYDLHNNLFNARSGYLPQYRKAVAASGKESWMTEWETRHEHTHSDWEVISETMAHFNRDVSSLGFNGWLSWQVWSGTTTDETPADVGMAIDRSRPGDVLIYKNVDVGANPKFLNLRIAAKDKSNLKLEVRTGAADGPLIGELNVPKTSNAERDFKTVPVELKPVSGKQDIYLKYVSNEHWREASLNWLQFEGGPKIEAEDLSDATRIERWTSSVAPVFNVNARKDWVLDDNTTLQKRPLYYIFQKIWNNAPAGKGTFVRRVTSSDPALQGATDEADAKAFRQDLLAFVNGQKMTVIAMNRQQSDKAVNLVGLTGKTATLYRYSEADAATVNREMTKVGEVPIEGGKISGLNLPTQSFNLLVTE